MKNCLRNDSVYPFNQRGGFTVQNKLWNWLPLVYLVFSVTAVILITLKFPLFQHADENVHFLRAEQISAGGLLGVKRDNNASGGYVDKAAVEITNELRKLKRRECVDLSAIDRSTHIYWSGQRVYAGYANTSIYPPIGYAPVALGILTGKLLGLSVAKTAYLARLVNGLFAVAISFIALKLCTRGRFLMFSVLLLPMTLSLFASLSQDAILIAMSALLAALLSRILTAGPDLKTRWPETALLVLCLLMLGSSKVPYGALLLILLLPGVVPGAHDSPRGWLRGLLLASMVGLTLLAWTIFTVKYLSVPLGGASDIKAQLQHLAWNPDALLHIPQRTLEKFGIYYIKGFIGLLGGWLDVAFPDAFYWAAGVALFLAWWLDTTQYARLAWGRQFIILCSILMASAGIFVALYLSYTWVGARYIDGVQGRYFLPLAPLLGLLGPSGGKLTNRLSILGWYVLIFPLVTLALLPYVIEQRYFLCG